MVAVACKLLELSAAQVDLHDDVQDVGQDVTHEVDVHGARDVDVQLLVTRLVLQELLLDEAKRDLW